MIAKRLLESGEDVKILDLWKSKDVIDDVEFIKCDIRDESKIFDSMKGVDIVHHNVAQVPLTKAGRDFWDVNVRGSKITAQQALKSRVQGFIHMSSSAIYGDVRKMPIDENTPTCPIEIYGRSKLAGEQTVKEIFKDTKTPLITIRPRTILGEGRLGIFQILFDWIKENKKIYVIGNGNNKFQFIHANDLIDAYMIGYRNGKSETYNVGTNKFGTLKESIESLISYAGSKSKLKKLPTYLSISTLKVLDHLNLCPLAPWHYLTYHKDFYYDTSKLINLGWKPKYSNEDMIFESYDSFMKKIENDVYDHQSPHRKPVNEKILKIIKWLS